MTLNFCPHGDPDCDGRLARCPACEADLEARREEFAAHEAWEANQDAITLTLREERGPCGFCTALTNLSQVAESFKHLPPATLVYEAYQAILHNDEVMPTLEALRAIREKAEDPENEQDG